jgi:hypothetical protein
MSETKDNGMTPEKRPSTHPDPQVRAVVDSLPPLTDRQRANLAVLFAPYVRQVRKEDGE